MPDTPKYPVGTWVRFPQNGRLVIGAVQYNQPRSPFTYSGGAFDVVTDVGTVPENAVLEARRSDANQA